MEEQKLIQERKEKLLSFFKEKYLWISYVVLALLVWLSVWLRTRNLPGLKDITTGTWTLGPDLDPFLFLRWAKDIVENGSLMALDAMRYSPIGYKTSLEVLLHPYLIAWFHNLVSMVGLSDSVEYSSIIYPVFMFALTVIAFFLFVRKVFVTNLGELYSNIVALVASLFLITIPAILPRTIAGIPEKEASGFFFMFLSFYLFLSAWKAKNTKYRYTLAILAGASTAAMAGVWGGFFFILLTISIGLLISFLVGALDEKKVTISVIWIIASYVLMTLMSDRYSPSSLINSTTTLIPLIVIALCLLHIIIDKSKFISHKISTTRLANLPKPLVTIILLLSLGIILTILCLVFGVVDISFFTNKFADITRPLVVPVTSRLGVTVAENKQPFFGEWADSFGPIIKGIPLFFWIFFIGSIYLYYHMIRFLNRREKIIMTSGFGFFLFAIIFSRYSAASVLNGTNMTSIGLYLLGVAVFIASFGKGYYDLWKRKEEDKLREIDFGLIMVFSLFFFSIVSARGAVRLVMMLVPPAAIIAGYFIVALWIDARKVKDESQKLYAMIFFVLILVSMIYSAYYFNASTSAMAQSYVPSIYTQQWQKAMGWVRENTPQDAVFSHWWDYGYWVQSIGERATMVDGGNQYEYWNHLVGRHALTAPDDKEGLSLLYSHNVTHFLIDSTDIGKYGAFSSIGSDIDYDRASFIGTLTINPQGTRENKNSTTYIYQGGIPVDQDIIYKDANSTIMLPANKAGLGAVQVERNSQGEVISAPMGIFIYQNRQVNIPLKYIYVDGELYEFKNGYNSGIYIMPAVIVTEQGASIAQNSVALYLSNRTVKSQVARLFLYKENNPYFKLVHSEDDFLVQQLKDQGALTANQDIVYYQGLRGPIRIWEITYPKNVEYKDEYVQTTYPDSRLRDSR